MTCGRGPLGHCREWTGLGRTGRRYTAGQRRWDRVGRPKPHFSEGTQHFCSVHRFRCDQLRTAQTAGNVCPNLANQKVPARWPVRSYPAEVDRPSVTLGWGPGEKLTKGRARRWMQRETLNS